MPEPTTFPRHLVSIHDLSAGHVREIFDLATELRGLPAAQARSLLAGRIVSMLFFQPSTRTRLGFESSAIQLGAAVTGFSDPSTTRSVDYIAETLEDTVQVVGQMCDAMVLRHFVSGAAHRAARVAGVPVINGGDGSNEHPTQALADIWLIEQRLGGIGDAVLGLVGDPGTRVLRSLALTASRLGVKKILFLVPPNLPINTLLDSRSVHTTLPRDVKLHLDRANVCYEFRSDVCELLAEADAIEMMPVRIPALDADPSKLLKQPYVTPERYRITAAKVSSTRSRALILHPGPRSDELHPDVDDLPNGLYFHQVREAMFVRMAALVRLTSAPSGPPSAITDAVPRPQRETIS